MARIVTLEGIDALYPLQAEALLKAATLVLNTNEKTWPSGERLTSRQRVSLKCAIEKLEQAIRMA